MVFSPQVHRGIKVFTAVATVGVGIQAVFFSDYDIDGFEGQQHVFSNVQRDLRDFVDRNVFGIDISKTPNTQGKKDSN